MWSQTTPRNPLQQGTTALVFDVAVDPGAALALCPLDFLQGSDGSTLLPESREKDVRNGATGYEIEINLG